MLSATLGDSVVTFNELLYNPAVGDTGGEWIELHNQLSVDVNLGNWRISGGIDYNFAPGTTIESGEYLVVAQNPVALEAATGLTGVLGGYTGSLSNGGETIRLRDLNDRIMDKLIYEDEGDWPVAADGIGATLAKTNEHLATGDFEAWHFSATVGGTPGSANVISDNLLRLSEISGETDANFRIEVENTSSSTLNLSEYSLVWDGATTATYPLSGFVTAGGFTSFSQANTGFNPLDGDKIFLIGSGNAVADGAEIKLTSRARSAQWDGRWQRPDVATFGTGNSFDFEDAIVINEILYHQLPDSSVAPQTTSQLLVNYDSSWRFTDEAQETGWATSSHATWASGQGALGLENSNLPHPILTSLALGQRTYYFETEFSFAGAPSTVDSLNISHLVDDGAVFYLNGVEVGRFNFNANTIVTSTSLADDVVGNATANTLIIDPSQLVNGTNRLSVEVHQRTDGSSDIVFGASVAAVGVATPEIPYSEDPEEWIELYNNSNNTVDLSGWEFEEGIGYEFTPGTTLAAGDYLVIAGDQAALAAKYPGVNIAGEFRGGLSNSGERIQLVDAVGNLADEVIYYDDGAFDDRADGNGSSLELRDADADNSNGQAWAASEASPGQWQTVSYTGPAIAPALGNNIWHEFVFNLLQAGEVLIDDLSVIENPGTASATELIQDGTFSSTASLNTYRAGGNHGDVSIVVDPDNPGESVLRLRTTGEPEHIYNHVETTLASGAVIQEGTTYQISYRAKWISGSNQLNTRLYFNYLPNTEVLQRPKTVGTPGTVNSTAETNIGPVYTDLAQSVVTPLNNQAVTISVTAEDPDGITIMQLRYRVNEGAWNTVSMLALSGSLFAGTIPGQSSGSIVQFYVEGTDNLGASSTFPAEGVDSRALYAVATSASNSNNSIQIIMLQSEYNNLTPNTNTLSNQAIGATVVDETGKIYYDVQSRLRGGSASRNTSGRGYWIGFDPADQYRGVHDTVLVDRGNLNELFSEFLLQSAGGVPSFYNDAINVALPGGTTGQATLKMARYGSVWSNGQYEDGSDGTVFDMDLSYQPNNTVNGDPESPKVTRPYNHTNGQPDFTSYGPDKESYRHFFTIKDHLVEDDFSGLIQFLSAFDYEGDELYAQVDQIGDIDQIARVFVAESLLGHDDFYTRIWPHNFRLYENPNTGKFEALPWDLDRGFRIDVNSDLWTTPADGQVNKLFDLPQVSRLMYGHADHMIQTTFNRAFTESWADHFASVRGSNYDSLVVYIEDRAAAVMSQLPALTAFDITTKGGNTVSVDANQVLLEGTGSYQIRNILIDGFTDPLEVTWVDATTWQVLVNVNPGTNNLTFRALDYSGNEIHSDAIIVVSTDNSALAQDHLRITELNYHPDDPTAAELAIDPTLGNNNFEFVELINTSTTQSLNLNGVQFVQEVINNDNQGISFTFGDIDLAPGERIVIAEDLAAFEIRYTDSVNVAGEYSGNLSNSGETITLRDATGQTIQQFAYDDATPWPTSTDGRGNSLVIVDTAGDYNSSSNWTAAAPSPGFLEDSFLLGDMNQDGVVNFSDIPSFIVLLQTGTYLAEADINGDGIVDFLDIGHFVDLLINL